MPSIKENLIATKALISKPENWTQGGHEPFPEGGRWTLHAAVDRICWKRPRQFSDASDALRKELWGGHRSLAGFNDSRTHQDVMNLLETAIAGS